jgi:TatD DNase family protein
MNLKEYKYYLDMHCHYDELSLNQIKNISEDIISVSASVDFNSYKRLEKIKENNFKNMYFAYGLYPDQILEKTLKECYEDLDNMDFSNAIAIGEIGLDNKITKDKVKREEQKKLFEKQLSIAKKINKPVVIHTRYATKPTLEILTAWKDLKIILHWFVGNEKEITTALDRGYYLTQRFASPIIQNPKEHLDQLFIETDFPVPFRGETIIPNDIKLSYNEFCKQYNLDLDELKKITTNNFLKLFPSLNV